MKIKKQITTMAQKPNMCASLHSITSLNNNLALDADFPVNGIWATERAAFFYIRVIHSDAASYVAQDWL